jgi:hypothetical protein
MQKTAEEKTQERKDIESKPVEKFQLDKESDNFAEPETTKEIIQNKSNNKLSAEVEKTKQNNNADTVNLPIEPVVVEKSNEVRENPLNASGSLEADPNGAKLDKST